MNFYDDSVIRAAHYCKFGVYTYASQLTTFPLFCSVSFRLFLEEKNAPRDFFFPFINLFLFVTAIFFCFIMLRAYFMPTISYILVSCPLFIKAMQIEWFLVAFRQQQKSTNAQFISYYPVMESMNNKKIANILFRFCVLKEKKPNDRTKAWISACAAALK